MTEQYTPPPYEKYETPSDIKNADDLTHAEKVTLLETWAADALALARASSEGMTETEQSDEHALRLSEIDRVLEDVKGDDAST